jgi:hypothetical protein
MASVNAATQVGIHEDLSDKLVVADAKSTPLTSMMPKGKKATNVLYEWPVSQIPQPDTTPIPDGKPVDKTENLSGPRALLQGRVQKVRRAFAVTEFAEDVNRPAGITSEFKAAKANALIAVKRAIEAVFAGNQDSSLNGSTYQCRGLGKWLSGVAGSDLPIPAAYLTPAGAVYTGTLANLTEQNIRSIMQSIYENTGKKGTWDCIAGPDLKATVSKMTIYDDSGGIGASKAIVRTFFAKLEDNTLDGVVDVVKGDFGVIRMHDDLWLNWDNVQKLPDTQRGYVLDMSDVEMKANKLPRYAPLPFDDSGPKGVVSAIVSIKVGSPLFHGMIAPPSTN